MSYSLKKYGKISIVFIALFLMTLIISSTTNTVISNSNENIIETLNGYISHSPILIDSDDDFTAFPGNGSIDDPYIIEGYHISSTSSVTCIAIRWTSKAFIIRNCYLEGSAPAVSLNEVGDNNAIITNNTMLTGGIFIIYSNNHTVTNNTISSGSGEAFFIQYSDNNTISDNIMTDHNDCLRFSNSNYNNITNNTANTNTVGIELSQSSFNLIKDNKCLNNNYRGIRLRTSSNNNTLLNNECVGHDFEGIDISSSHNNTLIGNILDDNNDVGIKLVDSHNNSFINNTLSNQSRGFILETSLRNSMINNSLVNNYYGMEIESSHNTSIIDNEFTDNDYGIRLDLSDDSVLKRNYIYGTVTGIFTIGSSDLLIIENFIQNHNMYGLNMEFNSNNNLIYSNVFYNNIHQSSGHSQARSFGANNYWYNIITSLGNSWSDYGGEEAYAIDGGFYSDLFPSEYPVICPNISNVNHTPLTPTNEDIISVTADITDPSGIEYAKLFYRVNGSSWIEVSMIEEEVSDFNATIGPFNTGETIDYYILAKDKSLIFIIGINDNSSSYYSFTIHEKIETEPTITETEPTITETEPTITETISFPSVITLLTLVFTTLLVVVLKSKNRRS
ncbi:MAG: hypothetical protein GPJ51_08600 [Candidatus Heimdallarchaeota archaeon]|nr:hypothetical protein [Candidatus Heimdallarchaeota archaeon]